MKHFPPPPRPDCDSCQSHDLDEEPACGVGPPSKGILCTDSRGGYDAIEINESPLLGLSNMRAALQPFQLRDNLRRTGCELRWLASDYDLADALTKKRPEARLGLVKFMRTGLWSIKFDPSFTSSRKAKRQGKSALTDVDRHVHSKQFESTHR